MSYKKLNEEELKNRISQDYFSQYDCARIIGKIDFCVQPSDEFQQPGFLGETSLLWAEAKSGNKDIFLMFAQLILTIGKAKTFTKHMPPAFLGVFDAEKIAFVPYEKIHVLFWLNDFNWNVTPSNTTTKEFAQIKELVAEILDSEQYLFHYKTQDRELRNFIKNNIAKGQGIGQLQIDTNNFTATYHQWRKEILPLIDANFDHIKKMYGIQDCDFYLADLFVEDTEEIDMQFSVKESLFVTFYVVQKKGKYEGQYEIRKENIVKNLFESDVSDKIFTVKNLEQYFTFWNRYQRPPRKKYHDEIIKRRDLLVPQDFRERKGAFFTPREWVILSQEAIAKTLGENWQDEYYVWDCCAGTGNLLAFLKNKERLFASTLDPADVQSIKEQISSGANLLEQNVFQFDFLNDIFFDGPKATFDPYTGKSLGEIFVRSNMPQALQNILKNPVKRQKLLIYMNPPYAEAGNSKTVINTGKHKAKTTTINATYAKYRSEIGKASNELFAQFLIRIYREISGCKIANFSKLKNLQGSNFSRFRESFLAKLESIFLLPANTFDNVSGEFPIGFFVWDTLKKEVFQEIVADVYDKKGEKLSPKKIYSSQNKERINTWLAEIKENVPNKENAPNIGFLVPGRNDLQHTKYNYIINTNEKQSDPRGMWITEYNLIPSSVYLAVHHCIKATWLNDRDQFLYPNDSWEHDTNFHNDCLAFTLFHSQNRIRSEIDIKYQITLPDGEIIYNTIDGYPRYINHWIPFTESEVQAKERFSSHFMSDFIAGKIKLTNGNGDIFNKPKVENGTKCKFSPQAQAVIDAGRKLWSYYHAQKNANANASLYDIREYFQGRNERTGRMNNKSEDATYNELTEKLKEQLNCLAEKITEKVYKHGFLLR